jgi:16S rRNA G966 N2-methylase RsmD
LKLLDEHPLLRKNGIIVAQLHKKEKMDTDLSRLVLFKSKKHGITVIQFYKYVER